MTGRFVDNLFYNFKKEQDFEDLTYLETDFGKVRIFDSGGNKPSIINVPDAPNSIEHQKNILRKLSKNFRVVCFEYPGAGFSYPNSTFDYSFQHGAGLIFQIMEILKIEKTSLLFSCSNGYYALKAAMIASDKFKHVFIAQTPSIQSIADWTKSNIPSILKIPIIGQLTNRLFIEKFSNVWYDVALPRDSLIKNEFKSKAHQSIKRGGCFCLSSLVQGLSMEIHNTLNIGNTNVTLVWGAKDYSHRKTSKESILNHVQNCEIIEFKECGHFPELENAEKFVKLVNERLA